MTKPEWGAKRVCQACGARFYDMERTPIICPKCGAEYALPVAAAIPASEVMPDDPPKKAKTVVVDDENIDLEDVDLDDIELDEVSEDNKDDLMEDTSELDDDEDDMSEVMEHMEPHEDM